MLTMFQILALNALNAALVAAVVLSIILVAYHIVMRIDHSDHKPERPYSSDREYDEKMKGIEAYNEKAERLVGNIVRQLFITAAVFSVSVVVPDADDVLEAYLKSEAGKVVNADTAKVVAEEVLKRVDKALDIAAEKK